MRSGPSSAQQVWAEARSSKNEIHYWRFLASNFSFLSLKKIILKTWILLQLLTLHPKTMHGACEFEKVIWTILKNSKKNRRRRRRKNNPKITQDDMMTFWLLFHDGSLFHLSVTKHENVEFLEIDGRQKCTTVFPRRSHFSTTLEPLEKLSGF